MVMAEANDDIIDKNNINLKILINVHPKVTHSTWYFKNVNHSYLVELNPMHNSFFYAFKCHTYLFLNWHFTKHCFITRLAKSGQHSLDLKIDSLDVTNKLEVHIF